MWVPHIALQLSIANESITLRLLPNVLRPVLNVHPVVIPWTALRDRKRRCSTPIISKHFNQSVLELNQIIQDLLVKALCPLQFAPLDIRRVEESELRKCCHTLFPELFVMVTAATGPMIECGPPGGELIWAAGIPQQTQVGEVREANRDILEEGLQIRDSIVVERENFELRVHHTNWPGILVESPAYHGQSVVVQHETLQMFE